MIRYDKLVRDRIPEIIEANGQDCTVRTLSAQEYAERLDQKLAEELAEYQESGALEELVDLMELVRAIAHHRGTTWEAFEQLLTSKRENRGGFEKRLLLEAVHPVDQP